MTELPIKFGLRFFNSVALENAANQVPPEIWNLSLDELKELARPTDKDESLKFRYWKLVREALFNRTEYTLGRLNDGICTYTHLYNNFLSNPYKVAWLLKQSSDKKAELAALQDSCLDHLKEIMILDIRRKNGSLNHPVIKLKIEAMKVLFAAQDNK